MNFEYHCALHDSSLITGFALQQIWQIATKHYPTHWTRQVSFSTCGDPSAGRGPTGFRYLSYILSGDSHELFFSCMQILHFVFVFFRIMKIGNSILFSFCVSMSAAPFTAGGEGARCVITRVAQASQTSMFRLITCRVILVAKQKEIHTRHDFTHIGIITSWRWFHS